MFEMTFTRVTEEKEVLGAWTCYISVVSAEGAEHAGERQRKTGNRKKNKRERERDKKDI